MHNTKKILNQLTLIIFGTLVWMTSSCNDQDGNKAGPQPENGTFIDLGEIPVPVAGHSDFAENEFQIAAYSNNVVFVATSDGLWKNNLLTKEWSRSGFDGKKVSCIFKHPNIPNKLFAGVMPAENSTEKSLFISDNGGETWKAAESPVHDDLDNVYETYVCIAVRPDHPDHIYANLAGGTMIAVSTDGGNTWKRMNDEAHSSFGYRSNIVFIPNNPDQLFQGSENPFDDAWLGRYDIDTKDPARLKNFIKVADVSVFGNRRPVELQTNAFTGSSIYVGQEGALAKITGSATQFIFKAEEENPAVPYTYVYGVWIDPKDPRHILFGGSVNGSQTSANLFETFDEGQHINTLTQVPGPANIQVAKILATETDPVIVAYDPDIRKIRLFVYKPR